MKGSTNSKDKHVFLPARAEKAVTLEENMQERSAVQKSNDGEEGNRRGEGGDEDEEQQQKTGGERGSAGNEERESK